MRARISATSAVPKQVPDGAGVGEGALADRGGEFAAVVDQLADEASRFAERLGRVDGSGTLASAGMNATRT